jgi:hypothetical protein
MLEISLKTGENRGQTGRSPCEKALKAEPNNAGAALCAMSELEMIQRSKIFCA